MTYVTILYDVQDHIATITLNRPDKLNAANPRMIDELIDAFNTVDQDDEIRAVIITGAGRAFCAGADISEGAKAFTTRGETPIDASKSSDLVLSRDGGGLLTLRIYKCLKPVIAAFNGDAVGVGVTMMLPADIRIASQSARFGFVFARRGIVPEAASSFFLPRIVGISRALQWCFSGRILSSNEALQGGLVTSVVAPDELTHAARAVALEIATNTSPISIALTRQMMWRGLEQNHPMEAHKIDSALMAARSASLDAVEGVQSFFDKRAVSFSDRVSSDMPLGYPWWSEPGF